MIHTHTRHFHIKSHIFFKSLSRIVLSSSDSSVLAPWQYILVSLTLWWISRCRQLSRNWKIDIFLFETCRMIWKCMRRINFYRRKFWLKFYHPLHFCLHSILEQNSFTFELQEKWAHIFTSDKSNKKTRKIELMSSRLITFTSCNHWKPGIYINDELSRHIKY